MRLIERGFYLERLKRVMGTRDIKVLTGVRRCGKSKLLEAFMKYVKNNVADANIIHVNFNLPKFAQLLNAEPLYSYVDSHRQNGKRNFVLIDEVQMCDGFERTVNWLHAEERYDIYITGSNAFLLGNDLATLFTGRTFTIEVYPFSFAEYVKYYGMTTPSKSFENYLAEGGMSGSYDYVAQADKFNYLSEVYNTLIVRDIKQKYKIRNAQALDKISNYLMDNISNLTSANNVTTAFCEQGGKIDYKTVASYIDHLCNAFAFYKVRRFDIRGKRWLATNDKYYLCDHAFRFAKLGVKNPDYGRILENVVAIELLRRGYKIYAGMLYKKEIDFVAMKRDETLYIQVAQSIEDEATFKREVEPLLHIRSGYPKLLITRLQYPQYLYEGIRVVDAAEWLLEC